MAIDLWLLCVPVSPPPVLALVCQVGPFTFSHRLLGQEEPHPDGTLTHRNPWFLRNLTVGTGRCERRRELPSHGAVPGADEERSRWGSE